MRFFSFRSSTPVLLTLLALSGCGGDSDSEDSPSSPPASPFVADDSDLVDPDIHYPPRLSVLNVRLRALAGDAHTIADVNADRDPDDGHEPEIKVHFTADDYPDDGKTTNARLKIRGNTSRLASQKSYRLKLDGGVAHWRGEQVLQLNKHPFDLTRVRNQLAFDLMQDIPHLSSLRTQFVHVMFDEDANPATPDVDYGLYTHVEKMGKEYLATRGYDAASNLYKAADFAFHSDPRLQVTATGAPLDKRAFERVLSIENGKDHRKLLQMIDAISDESTDFETEFRRYFNRNNYLAWLAFNILLGNHDTVNQNFALYQPAGGERFYFLPWDYDGSLGFEAQPDIAEDGDIYDEWELGLSNWWGVPLHRRFIRQPGNLASLIAAVQVLRTHYLTPEKLKARLDSYRPLVEPVITRAPDLRYLPTVARRAETEKRKQEWAGEYLRLTTTVETNYNRFMTLLDKPMPFWQAAEVIEGTLLLTWDPAVDPQNNAVTYDVEVATRPDFSAGSIRFSQGHLTSTSVSTAPLPAGTYYMRVTATDSQGHVQRAFDRTEVGRKVYFGVLEFSLP